MRVGQDRTRHDTLVRLRCPRCGMYMTFARLGGPQKEIHQKPGRATCRLIVTPDPSGGPARVQQVPDDVYLEDLWHEAEVEWEREYLSGTELDPARRDESD